MRSLVLFVAASICLFSCEQSGLDGASKSQPQSTVVQGSSTPPDTTKMAKFQFEESVYDFGNINEGEVVKHTFTFTNTGKSDLLITDARGSCGCTIPKYPKTPIAPGEEGVIEVQFNSKNKSGANQKTVSIIANTYPEVTTISILANVQAKEEKGSTLAN